METAVDIDTAKVGTVRNLILDRYIYAAGRTNGWLLRLIAASKSSPPQHLPRCLRVQREKAMADLGSFGTFAAMRLKVGFTNFGRFIHQAAKRRLRMSSLFALTNSLMPNQDSLLIDLGNSCLSHCFRNGNPCDKLEYQQNWDFSLYFPC